MKLLLARGADPKINTVLGVTPLHVAAGIGWVEGITYEWSPKATLEAVKMLLDLGLDVNAQADTGRTALHGAAHKGRADVIQILVDHGAQARRPRLRQHRQPRRQAGRPHLAGRWTTPTASCASACSRPSRIRRPALLLRKLMTAQGLPAPPMGRTLESICITEACE